MNRVKIGEIVPLNNGDVRGMELSGDYLKMSGLVVTTVHPDSIDISDNSIDFTYTVGDSQITRSYSLETNGDGEITAFTNPDGTRTKVRRNG